MEREEGNLLYLRSLMKENIQTRNIIRITEAPGQ